MRRERLSLGLVLVLCSCWLVPQAAWGDGPAVPTDEEIAELVAGLDADEFLARERAMDALIAAGEPAIEPVAEAALGSSPEVSLRGVRILEELAMSEDVALGDLAVQSLDNISTSGNSVAANAALVTLESLAQQREERAIRELERLGAVVSRSQIQVNLQIINQIVNIEIGDNWQGEPDDLRHLRWLVQTRMITLAHPDVTDEHLSYVGRMTGLQVLKINRASISGEGFAQLEHLNNLRQLEVLYAPLGDDSIDLILDLPNVQYVRMIGNDFSREGADRLRDNLRALTIDIRRGAFLGVSCTTLEGQCNISSVEPNSAAQRAGLQAGDRVISIDEEPVPDSPTLTLIVSQYGPGEKAEIVVVRNGEEQNFEVEFGEWDN